MYQDAVSDGAEQNLRKNVFPWHLKSVQDAVVMDQIKDSESLIIGEIGGGDTRILPTLREKNKVYNIEKFEGADGGPTETLKFPGVENIYTWVGDSKALIEDNFFDLIFSVSVVEHIPNANLAGFIEDCARILKPGGKMIHAVDAYLPERSYVFNDYNYIEYLNNRMDLYRSAFLSNYFEPLETLEINTIDDLVFQGTYASNPDNIMQEWNNVAPDLSDLRDNAQSTSLMWGGRKA